MASRKNNTETKIARELDGIVRRAQAAIFWERLWPKALPSLSVGGAFLTACWTLPLASFPPLALAAGVAVSGAAAVAPFFTKKTGSLFVTREEALRRIDAHTGDPSRPAQTLRDRLGENSAPAEKSLWDRHLTKTWEKWAGRLKAHKPAPGVSARAYGVGAAIALSALIAGGVAGERRFEKVADAFDWSARPVPQAPLRANIWVVPPENIQGQQHNLTEESAGQALGSEKLKAHKNSTLTVLTYDSAAKVLVNGAELALKKSFVSKSGGEEKQTYQYESLLTAEATAVTVEKGDQRVSWQFAVTPDNAPTATLDGASINEKDNRLLEIACTANDDFGIREGEIRLRLPQKDPKAEPLPSATLPVISLPRQTLCK